MRYVEGALGGENTESSIGVVGVEDPELKRLAAGDFLGEMYFSLDIHLPLDWDFGFDMMNLR